MFKYEVNSWHSMAFWSSNLPALRRKIACSLSDDLLAKHALYEFYEAQPPIYCSPACSLSESLVNGAQV